MKNLNNDILSGHTELKEMPFATPEGYFEKFKTAAYRPKAETASLRSRMVPYISVAAAFILLVAAGTLVLENTTGRQDMTQEDYIMFSDNMMNTISYEMDDEVRIADAEIENEDIINYLIYSGITAEEVELSK